MNTLSDKLNTPRGAYGLTFEGTLLNNQVRRHFLVDAPSGWPRWEIHWEPLPEEGQNTLPAEMWSPELALVTAQPDGYTDIDRLGASTTLHLPRSPSSASVVHPFLASTGVVAGHWLGRTPFHAGSFELGGRAWGVLGGREMGKSSLLMWLHRSGVPILSDDVLVLDGMTAYAGPRCLDLRESAAQRFEEGDHLGVVGTRERWRVTLPGCPSEVPFGGWVVLNWASAGFGGRDRRPRRDSQHWPHIAPSSPRVCGPTGSLTYWRVRWWNSPALGIGARLRQP